VDFFCKKFVRKFFFVKKKYILYKIKNKRISFKKIKKNKTCTIFVKNILRRKYLSKKFISGFFL